MRTHLLGASSIFFVFSLACDDVNFFADGSDGKKKDKSKSEVSDQGVGHQNQVGSAGEEHDQVVTTATGNQVVDLNGNSTELICYEESSASGGWGAAQPQASCNQKHTYVFCSEGEAGLECEPFAPGLKLEALPQSVRDAGGVGDVLNGINQQDFGQCLQLAQTIKTIKTSQTLDFPDHECFRVTSK